ncbi:fungal-specific transcription factor domain-containing protein [Aspergillus coremiiformis]|uniref:Fungal-specific transcription factor domain-containing protein n=1 Tax=Aspergillus coremiiformis TaxID=138285 RepID=A0A5N6Z154_9EURO|nr:fungal-specific transcription factor domain-containing protein [Aspergillus coremiiformis]
MWLTLICFTIHLNLGLKPILFVNLSWKLVCHCYCLLSLSSLLFWLGMEDIKIPSPSAILDPQPAVPSTGGLSRPLRSPTTKKTISGQTATSATITGKPKQSKSRNGCVTCKAKRLKCDESKPTCFQCKKRNVECGGYKKDFKWRPFEETNVAGRVSTAKGKKVTLSPPGRRANLSLSNSPATENSTAQIKTQVAASQPLALDTRNAPQSHTLASQLSGSSPNQLNSCRVTQKNLTLFADDLLDTTTLGQDEDAFMPSLAEIAPSDESPWPSDISLPTAEFDISPGEATLAVSGEDTIHESDFSFAALLEGDNEDIEEIVRQSDQTMSPSLFEIAGTSVTPRSGDANISLGLFREPTIAAGSPERLMLHFDRYTCGILSVKDGVHENPWRTLVWPLAKDTPALYHAIFSLSAFHCSKKNPSLRVHGVDHMRRSITYMVQDIRNMRADAALATSLALAFADTWDQHTRSCIQHLRGAKALVSQVVQLGLQTGLCTADLDRVRFLYNTWLYMDVIARLTSLEKSGDQEIDLSILQLPRGAVHEIDPLMGCATTLFPLIDRVAQLIQRVRRTNSNSISLVSEAIELKRCVEEWEPPDWFEPPEDPTSEVQDSIQIAHAYRWATILYLHQAVPEMPSEPASELAKRVLLLLATVPPSSRTTIIQTFPLLAAGCEADQEEDRQWVLSRWKSIQTRLMLGSIDRCVEVVHEVWVRRDQFEAEKQRAQFRGAGRSNSLDDREPIGRDGRSYASTAPGDFNNSTLFAKEPCRRPVSDDRAISSRGTGNPRRSSAVSPLENIEFEKTVRGRLHWVNVMQEWGWEVFLG